MIEPLVAALCLIQLCFRDPTVVVSELRTWCKSVSGALQYLARSTRWGISHAMSRLSQLNANPTQGMVDSIRYLAGYLRGTVDFKLHYRYLVWTLS